MIDPFVDDDGFDIADELLAALDARDAQEAAAAKDNNSNDKKQAAPIASPDSSVNSQHHGLRGAGERFINGFRHHNHNHNDHDVPSASDPDSAAALAGTSPNTGRKSSIRKLFGSSPKSPESSPIDAAAPKKKVSRQQQRKASFYHSILLSHRWNCRD